MTWTKIDDSFMDHPKVVGLGDDGPTAIYLWTAGLCYAGRYLTDGFVPAAMVPRLSTFAAAEAAQALVRAGLWEEAPGGFRIHDFLDYNPSRADALERRRKEAERKAEWRERRTRPGGTDAVTDAGTDAGTDGVRPATPVPGPVPGPLPGPGPVGHDVTNAVTEPTEPRGTYTELTGIAPVGKLSEWIGDLVRQNGDALVDRVLRQEWEARPDRTGFLERVKARLSNGRPSSADPPGRWEFDNETNVARWIPDDDDGSHGSHNSHDDEAAP